MGITNELKSSDRWFFEYELFRPSLQIPLQDKPTTVKIPKKKMKQRVRRSQTDERVEPFAFFVKKDEDQIKTVARRFAKPGREAHLTNYLLSNVNSAESVRPGSANRNVFISKSAFQLIDQEKFGERFQNLHHTLAMQSAQLQRDPNLLRELLDQAEPYLGEPQIKKVKDKIARGVEVLVDEDFLPEFAKKMVKQFTIFRGPNCFHAALAFQNKKYTNSSAYNLIEEKGYHRAMINYDELWRTLKSEFYEVDVSKAALKYGDIITFFEVPNQNPGAVDYRWIRHTATYLFNGYTFSKGSKSPNTPYTVKTFKDEWDSWQSYVDLMAVKVFRKSGKNVKSAPATDLSDWLY